MRKRILEDRICFVFDSIQEAARWLAALEADRFYTQDGDQLVEISDLDNVVITLIADATVRRLGGEKDESVCGGEWLKNSIS